MSKDVLESVYAALMSEARKELLEALEPKVEQLLALGDEIIAQLGGATTPMKKPGKAVKKQIAPAAAIPERTQLSRKGALQAMIRSVLVAHHGKPLSIAEIRDELLKKTLYRDYDSMRLYTMVSQRIGQMEGLKEVKHKYRVTG